MTMLQGRLGPLWDVEDGEAFCRQIIEKVLRTRNGALDEHRREDLLQDIVFELWRLSGLDARLRPLVPRPGYAFNPGTGNFAGWARQKLYWAVLDWYRKTNGRTTWKFKDYVYERPKPVFLSFDKVHESRVGFPTSDLLPASSVRGVGDALGSSHLDPAECSDADLRGVLARGDSSQVWAAAPLGEPASKRAA